MSGTFLRSINFRAPARAAAWSIRRVMPEITSGNINATVIMIGEKAAEIVAADHGMRLNTMTGEFV